MLAILQKYEKCRKTPGTGMDQAHIEQQSVVVVFKVFRNCDNRWYRVPSCDTLIESHLIGNTRCMIYFRNYFCS